MTEASGDSSVQPNPEVWPECGNCGTAYVLRRSMRFNVSDPKHPSLAYEWLWQRDCPKGDTRNCKAAEPVVAGPGRDDG